MCSRLSFAPSPRVVLSISPFMSTRPCLLFLRARSLVLGWRRSLCRSRYGSWLFELPVVEPCARCVLPSAFSSSLPCVFNTNLSFVHAAFRWPVRLIRYFNHSPCLAALHSPYSRVVFVPRCLECAHPELLLRPSFAVAFRQACTRCASVAFNSLLALLVHVQHSRILTCDRHALLRSGCLLIGHRTDVENSA